MPSSGEEERLRTQGFIDRVLRFRVFVYGVREAKGIIKGLWGSEFHRECFEKYSEQRPTRRIEKNMKIRTSCRVWGRGATREEFLGTQDIGIRQKTKLTSLIS